MKLLLTFLVSLGLYLCDGTFYVYDYATPQQVSPAPKGYKPFYISHFARHGARYCTSEFDRVHDMLTKADKGGFLTAEGKAFLDKYEPFYQKVKTSKGNLTGVGKAQHRAIAEHMFIRFPEVFNGPTHVEAASTESARVIMSMWSCLSSLQKMDGDIEINADASAKYASWLQPSLSSNPYLIKGAYKSSASAQGALRKYFDKTTAWRDIAGRFFTDADVVEKELHLNPEKFIEYLHGVCVGTRCLDEDREYFNDVFSDEELSRMNKGLSAKYFMELANFEGAGSLATTYAAFTLEHILKSAEADIASGATQLRLRFGHDSGIAPLLVFMDVNGFGRSTGSFEEGFSIFPNYNIPMGASLQMVFYRNKSNDILVKVLLNESEAELPLRSVSGKFYRWKDVQEYYLPRINAAKEKIIVNLQK